MLSPFLFPELKRVDDLGECLGIFLCLVDYSLPHVVPEVHTLHVGCCGDDRVLMGVQENFHLLQRLFRLAAGYLFLAHVYSGSFMGIHVASIGSLGIWASLGLRGP